MPGSASDYRGRFAPSPTGPLHLGSLIAALASYLDAKHQQGRWLLRMEDLDPPREEPGAADRILQSLQDHGLLWDEKVLWQSRRADAYHSALNQLSSDGQLFRCDCTRAMLGPGGACHGHCLPRQEQVANHHALRVAVPANTHEGFTDQIQGAISADLGTSLPDFVLLRKDGLFAYQLAVVVDDAFQGITHIVRGSDLLDSTARQIFLQQQLGASTPRYCHIPVITNESGQKFSKQNHAPPLKSDNAPSSLRLALEFLRQAPPPPAATAAPDILAFAISSWDPGAIPASMSIDAGQLCRNS